MSAHYVMGAAASGRPKALVLRGETVSPEIRKLCGFLDALGVHWETVPAEQAERLGSGNEAERAEPYCLLGAAADVAQLLRDRTAGTTELPSAISRAESVYVYGFGEDAASRELLRFLTGSTSANVRPMQARRAFLAVSSDFREMCGPMSGLVFRAQTPEGQMLFDWAGDGEAASSIIGTNEGDLLVEARRAGTQFFLSSSTAILDVAARATKYIDVRECFSEAVPLIMYARQAFGLAANRHVGACLIVDDPPLKPRYGFMNFGRTVELMDRHNFATTIAFIPWNWKRTNRETVRLFRERPDRLSLCVHGCDHTAREFAERTGPVLYKRVMLANQRMQLLRGRTHLPHANVMLFPQGVFSAGAARVLKLNGFVAAANTEVAPVHPDENQTTVGDLLGMAIMKYASFPIFTRRYLAHGVENFAFDGLLGKPCLIAAHHDDFAGDARILLQVVQKLNGLNWELNWQSLGDVMGHSHIPREAQQGNDCVEMYGTRLIYRNTHGTSKKTTFLRRESDADRVREVTVNGTRVEHELRGDYLRFETTMEPKECADVRVLYSGTESQASTEDSLGYRGKALLRRYLSEFRDNYLSRNVHLQRRALRIKEALRF